MSSSTELVDFICDQLSEAGSIASKKMFGEYVLYCDGKLFASVCDDRLLVKITGAGKRLMPDCKTDLPYEGGKPCFLITELENRCFLKRLTQVTCAELTLSKPKAKKSGRAAGKV